ncbi:MAG TPA: molybdopterin-dependent oxidoreductase [Longimicrobiales bacterium]
MTDRTTLPGFLAGALVGALVTAPAIAVCYLGQQLAGLPFVPFDVFDAVARALPGAVVTFGIDALVAGIRALGLGEVSEVAKVAEQLLAIGGMFVAGVLAGAALFGVLRRWRPTSGLAAGLALGVLVGVPAVVIGAAVNRTATAGPIASALWVLLLFLGWGAALGWAYDRLAAAAVRAATAPTAVAEPIDRRTFVIRLGGAAAVITVVGAGVGAWLATVRERERARARGRPWSATHALPNADAEVRPVPGTRPELTPVEDHYRIDINTRPPVIDEGEWRLRFGGRVERPTEWTLEALRSRYAPLHQFVTLSCISNPVGGDLIGTQRWTGVPLRRILEEVRPLPGATHLRIRSADDFHEVLPIADAMADERILLTYAWDGLPLPAEHGFPLRLYIPDRYGMKQPKWIETIEAIDGDEAGYWVRRGWDAEARMHATSVIDVVGVDMMVIQADRGTRIPIGGIAHAGARGISRVEVRVDGGPWQPARLRAPLSDTTWVLWVFDWPFQPGAHTFTVRCFEGDGTPQEARRAPVRPAGATGLHGKDVMV